MTLVCFGCVLTVPSLAAFSTSAGSLLLLLEGLALFAAASPDDDAYSNNIQKASITNIIDIYTNTQKPYNCTVLVSHMFVSPEVSYNNLRLFR